MPEFRTFECGIVKDGHQTLPLGGKVARGANVGSMGLKHIRTIPLTRMLH